MVELKPSSAIQRGPLNKGGWDAPHALHNDGAIDRYAHWRTFYQERFKYTRATGKSTLIFLVAFPALIGYVAYQSEGLFEFAGKRRGESVTTRG
ncbi:NUVM protein [Yarrowia lipolytica]|uniref:YALI0F06061p n=2 Tax=Yarrowia lipolytica TaxID=4952 RepID=B5RSK9_YARLI|nr:YALI0F06061p [Yarrowia lipolytica CLIB122]6GCS_j Chain j, NB5M SUBUNIT [Yarrowia lipolytica]6RFQ_j Chain j, Subunit NUUM of NADH:Ubiquinone Oxidoreductase (Complex I) [Yarrowia lipolytica]6RFR_j Chain j, Subunit NB5M of NADH:Ubiquinone Oxidoreductase (Complex I) [Yarrowia lipolytica]6RFS_j Chain j, Subunit NB5M of NADH:Ubiquinone Oxidoreductase (Complex I) [Yarrowia lipolytica]6Y79_j Chain j, Subunit NB5M of NADH:Ubiquinone Oxidoreductase (Complex I) [Yarrowia lipolytica]6YJ4_m Chain m, Su|eukprot:XP_002143105.1 YALI0F06061p [Yarrowia lipolytica CLIB122]